MSGEGDSAGRPAGRSLAWAILGSMLLMGVAQWLLGDLAVISFVLPGLGLLWLARMERVSGMVFDGRWRWRPQGEPFDEVIVPVHRYAGIFFLVVAICATVLQFAAPDAMRALAGERARVEHPAP